MSWSWLCASDSLKKCFPGRIVREWGSRTGNGNSPSKDEMWGKVLKGTSYLRACSNWKQESWAFMVSILLHHWLRSAPWNNPSLPALWAYWQNSCSVWGQPSTSSGHQMQNPKEAAVRMKTRKQQMQKDSHWYLCKLSVSIIMPPASISMSNAKSISLSQTLPLNYRPVHLSIGPLSCQQAPRIHLPQTGVIFFSSCTAFFSECHFHTPMNQFKQKLNSLCQVPHP